MENFNLLTFLSSLNVTHAGQVGMSNVQTGPAQVLLGTTRKLGGIGRGYTLWGARSSIENSHFPQQDRMRQAAHLCGYSHLTRLFKWWDIY